MALQSIYPALRYRDARAAIAWLCEAFGVTEQMIVPGEGDAVAHAQLAFGGNLILVGSASDGSDGRLAVDTGPAWLYLVVDDPDAHFARARAAGAEIVEELNDTDYGSRGYTAKDPEGNLWSFGTYRPEAEG